MDVVVHDDPCHLRTGHAPHNMATVRPIALNLIKTANEKAGIKLRRKEPHGPSLAPKQSSATPPEAVQATALYIPCNTIVRFTHSV